jgi:hypothetical protein
VKLNYFQPKTNVHQGVKRNQLTKVKIVICINAEPSKRRTNANIIKNERKIKTIVNQHPHVAVGDLFQLRYHQITISADQTLAYGTHQD